MNRSSTLYLAALLTLLSAERVARGDEPARSIDMAASKFTKLDTNRIHYKSFGRGETAVVFVHGWTCDLTSWRAQVPALEGKTRLLLIDLPGHGQSDKPKVEYTMDLFARSIDAVLKDAGVETAVLVGHSMGVPVVRQFYRVFPKKTRALVAVDGAIQPEKGDLEGYEQFSRRLAGPDFRVAQSEMIDSLFVEKSPPELRKGVKAVMQGTPQHVAVGAMRAMSDPALEKADKIEVPVLVVLAKTGPFFSPKVEKQFRAVAPKMDFRVLDDCGHFLMMEKPKEFNQALADFLTAEKLLKPE